MRGNGVNGRVFSDRDSGSNMPAERS